MPKIAHPLFKHKAAGNGSAPPRGRGPAARGREPSAPEPGTSLAQTQRLALRLHDRLVGYCDELAKVEALVHQLLLRETANKVSRLVSARDAAQVTPILQQIDADATISFAYLVDELRVCVAWLYEELGAEGEHA